MRRIPTVYREGIRKISHKTFTHETKFQHHVHFKKPSENRGQRQTDQPPRNAPTCSSSTPELVQLCGLFTSKCEEEKTFAAEYRPVFIDHLVYPEHLLGLTEEAHIGAASLFEAEIDHGVGVECEQGRQGVEEQRESRLKVDAVGCQDDVGSHVHDVLRKGFSPGHVVSG